MDKNTANFSIPNLALIELFERTEAVCGKAYSSLPLSSNKKQFENQSVDKVNKLWCYSRLIKKTLRFPKPQIYLEIFCSNLQSPVWSYNVGVPL